MTLGKLCVAAMIALVVTVMSGVGVVAAGSWMDFGSQEVTATVHDVYPAGPSHAVVAKTINGFLEVQAWDRPEVELTVEKKVRGRGVTQAKAPELLEGITVTVDKQPNRTEVVVKHPAGRRGIGYTADVTLRVPRDASVDLATTNGGITVRDTAGDAKAQTTNGAVTLRQVAGKVLAETTNGSVACEGPARYVSCRTTNGAVRVTQTAAPGTWEGLDCQTVNGAVEVTIPRETSFSLDARNVNGGMTVEFPITIQGKITNKHAVGKVGAGGPEVRLETVNGGITVRAGVAAEREAAAAAL